MDVFRSIRLRRHINSAMTRHANAGCDIVAVNCVIRLSIKYVFTLNLIAIIFLSVRINSLLVNSTECVWTWLKYSLTDNIILSINLHMFYALESGRVYYLNFFQSNGKKISIHDSTWVRRLARLSQQHHLAILEQIHREDRVVQLRPQMKRLVLGSRARLSCLVLVLGSHSRASPQVIITYRKPHEISRNSNVHVTLPALDASCIYARTCLGMNAG